MKIYNELDINEISTNLQELKLLLDSKLDLQLDFISRLIQLISSKEFEILMFEINSHEMWGKTGVYEDIGGMLPLNESVKFEEALVNIAVILLKYPNHYDGLKQLVNLSNKFIQSNQPPS